MPDWLPSWLSRTAPDTGLAARLADYLPYTAPYPGPGRELNEAQAQANLAHFQAVLPQRLQLAGNLLLVDAKIDTAPALADPIQGAPALADALQHWATSRWPALPPQPRPTTAHWLKSRREGGDIVFSMLLDLAIVLGEVIRRGNPDWHWGLDLDPQNIADDMLSARRVVLLADPVGAMPQPFVLDVEQVVVHRFLHAGDASQRLLNPFRRLVEEALRGDAMGHWRGAGGFRG